MQGQKINRLLLEVCVDTVKSAVAACAAGADRIELCSALDVGGVTPCQSLIQAVRRRISCPLVVLIRPRAGNFHYDQVELEQTLDSMRIALGCGADGVVVGALNAQQQLDLPALAAMRRAAQGYQLVMHRAFDFVGEPLVALEQLIELGFDRILTSGGPSGNVMNHLDDLRELVDRAAGRIVIMPGGGISAANALQVIDACNCSQLHGSFRTAALEFGSTGLGTNRDIDSAAIEHVVQKAEGSRQ